jgi:hypothetical protein
MPMYEKPEPLRIHFAPTSFEKWDDCDRDPTHTDVVSGDEIEDFRLQMDSILQSICNDVKSAICNLTASDPVPAQEIASRQTRACHCHRCGGDLIRSHVRRYERPLTLFGIKPYRCTDCKKRRWRC